MEKKLEIVFQDDHFVAVNKPYGWLTHRSSIAKDAEDIVLQTLRDQINRKVYPIHRIDRKTTGVLLLGLDPETHRTMSKIFQENTIDKTYIAIVRGYTEDSATIKHSLLNENEVLQDAITEYKTLQRTELPWSLGKFPTSRYSLVQLHPITGRMHQLRRHMSHIFHPIIGDRPHGCSKQNRMFKQNHQFTEMLLHAKAMEFKHPFSEKNIRIQAEFSSEFIRVAKLMNLDLESV